jgi:carbon starvation protein
MKSSLLASIGLISFYLGYLFYSKYISKTIFREKTDKKTPAHSYNDGVDFVPTHKNILLGHHFTSIAGAAPIIGPCIALYWGWLPAFIWIVIGIIFMGAVHDYGALVISAKEKGQTIGRLSSKVLNSRVRIMFLLFVACLTWLVLAVFANAIAGLFIKNPSSVIPINIEILIAIIIGILVYKKNWNALIPSILALIALYFFIFVGTKSPISLSDFGVQNEKHVWIVFLFIYSSIASLLPVWVLLQPRDYINSHQLFVGLGLIYFSIFVINPNISAPAINISEHGPSIFPFLFITVACGAISGFHGLVSSGTTSKQLNSFSEARQIGYGSMLGEGALGLASLIAAAAGLSLVAGCSFEGFYGTWEIASSNGAIPFISGSSAMLEKIGFSNIIASTLISVLVISFAATTLDTATRIQRMIMVELGSALRIELLKNKYFATLVGVLPAYLLVSNGMGGKLWPVFGTSNQMLAALTLMIISIYFWKKGRNVTPLVVPMIFLIFITLTALISKTHMFFQNNDYLLLSVNTILIGLIFWMVAEGFLLVRSKSNDK